MRIAKVDVQKIIEHARREKPKEACGILAGTTDKVEMLYPGTNIAENPQIRYLMDPKEQLKILREIDDKGVELVGIYHSHPQSPAYPSVTDKSLAFYPEAVYIIVSLMDNEHPVVRAFNIIGDDITELELVLEEGV